ncbi:MAG: hypothetical protein E7050_00095 [Lentisphaerae bacterium]|nr:hypothetical protein [Lentisphaerota bacterium]
MDAREALIAGLDGVGYPVSESWGFVDELRRPERRCFHLTRSEKRPDEVDLRAGVMLCRNFPDPEALLDSAWDNLESCFAEAGIRTDGGWQISACFGDAGKWDSFILDITGEKCTITAGNTEGIRRGLYYLESMLISADGKFLPQGRIHKKAWLKNRISRCFFGPIKRPPMNRDELTDQVDYYPEAYLNRLASEAVNGLWLTVSLRDLCCTPYFPDSGENAPARLAKLRQTVLKCRRFGIRIFLFMIEPAALNRNDEALKKHPAFDGAVYHGAVHCFCPSSDTAYDYLYRSVNQIFCQVPGLGGIVNISLGECPTTCLSSLPQSGDKRDVVVDCPRCSKIPLKEVMFNSLSAMCDGMRAASKDAEFISWYYLPAPQDQPDWTFELTHVPENCTILYNFESGCKSFQLGRERIGGDYWLSCVGPSENFRRMASVAAEAGIAVGAKIQCASSHELATVPYIPVPGQLYRKYRAMFETGVSTVMLGWYFGTYPGMMTQAAGMLAFEDFSGDESEFLIRLAQKQWHEKSAYVAEIWQGFADAYRNYPLSNAMQYFGPYHNGLIWPLYPFEQHLPMVPTYVVSGRSNGDTIGEILDNHTLDEVAALGRIMAEKWHEAYMKFAGLRDFAADDPGLLREISLAEALDLHFASGRNILEFYRLRAENNGFTEAMRAIAGDEIANSRKLAKLCESDSRLGFHSEAETYLYFPEKLQKRAEFLEKILLSPPQEVKLPQVAADGIFQGKTYSFSVKRNAGELIFSVSLDNNYENDQLFITLSGSPESKPLILDLNRSGTFYCNSLSQPGRKVTVYADHWQVEFIIRTDTFCKDGESFAMSVIRYTFDGSNTVFDCVPECPEAGTWRLLLGFYSPMRMLSVES